MMLMLTVAAVEWKGLWLIPKYRPFCPVCNLLLSYPTIGLPRSFRK